MTVRRFAMVMGVAFLLLVSLVLDAGDLDGGPWGMLTEEDDVEIHALARRGWSVSAIARHTGRDRKTVRRYLAGPPPSREPMR